MIPKIIHLCWLSGEPYPPEIQECLNTWKTHLPDYEIWLWDTKRFDINSTLWTKQAFEAKKYAFAADYIRLYALYNYGGIYLDSDVLVYKSFDELLSLPYFIGHDQIGGFEAAIIGAEKECKWIEDVLEHYNGRSFIQENGEMDVITLPVIFHHTLLKKGYTFICLHKLMAYEEARDSLEVRKTNKSFCAHNYAGSWQRKEWTWKDMAKKSIPKCLVRLFFYVSHNTWNKRKFSWYTIPFVK